VRGRILIARDDIRGARTAFESGLTSLDGLSMPYLRARLQFAYGQSLRRAGKRRDAAPHLNLARDLYATLGARTSVERCDRELNAGGLNLGRSTANPGIALTPQELAVTTLIASGKTNRQAAAELNVTGKTVQYHLTNIYSKFGISSRSELAVRVQAGEL
jgi:DNA-binding CsgD family transcriptional regulator